MKSFKDYVNYRSKKSVLEMAADPIYVKDHKGKQRKIVEVRKTPIFLDQDDIDYLYNFPPELYAQALQKRYGELLHKAHVAKEKGTKFNDSHVTINYRKNILKFPIDSEKINDLYERLSGDTDDESYSRLSSSDPEIEQKYLRGRTHSEKGNVLGPYAFNFSNYTRQKVKTKKGDESEIGYADGWVEPDLSTVRRVLRSWFSSIENGWHDDKISNEDEFVEINKRMLPSKGYRVWKAGEDFIVKEGKIKKFESHVPKLFPALMVSSRDFKKHKTKKDVLKSIRSDLENTKFEEYIEIIDLNSSDLINQNKLKEVLEEIEEISNKKSDKGYLDDENVSKKSKVETEKLNNRLAQLEKIKIAANYIRNNKNRFENYFKQEIAKIADDNEESKKIAVENAIFKFLKDVARVTERVLKRMVRKTRKYNVHQWNAAHINPSEESPQINWTGLGTMHNNSQQNETIYESLLQMLGNENIGSFYDHINHDLNLINSVRAGVENQLDTTLVEDFVEKDIKEAINKNIEDVADDAYYDSQNRLGKQHIINYARIYANELLKKGNNIEKFLSKKEVKTQIRKIKTVFNKNGSEYAKKLIQLYERFFKKKYNRTVRPENPWPNNATFIDVLNYLFKNKGYLDKLDPRTSHSIVTLKDIAGHVEEDVSKSINATPEQKSTNQKILGDIVNALFAKLSGSGAGSVDKLKSGGQISPETDDQAKKPGIGLSSLAQNQQSKKPGIGLSSLMQNN